MKALTKRQAKKFAQMYVAGLAYHHPFGIESIIEDTDTENIESEIKLIVCKISPVEDILASTDEILNYVREHF